MSLLNYCYLPLILKAYYLDFLIWTLNQGIKINLTKINLTQDLNVIWCLKLKFKI